MSEDDNTPIPGIPLTTPSFVFGTATFSHFYNSPSHLSGSLPVKSVQLALRYGICAFDTSVFYGNSEIVLGDALKQLELEFPRSQYQLMTKCGRYGPSTNCFDYSPNRIRHSVLQSLARLQTDYLDAVYLHDIEFVATPFGPSRSPGNLHLDALADDKTRAIYGLSSGDEASIRGEGDQEILVAIAELRKLKDEGRIKHVGISGYPLPVLLRIALLILHTPPFKPIDLLLSYSHLTLQNSSFLSFAHHFRHRAQVKQLLTASPFCMGLLTSSPPPWHPAPDDLKAAARQASTTAAETWPRGGLPDLALGFAVRICNSEKLPLVVGLSTPNEVHECVRVWRELQHQRGEETSAVRQSTEDSISSIFRKAGYLDWSWGYEIAP